MFAEMNVNIVSNTVSIRAVHAVTDSITWPCDRDLWPFDPKIAPPLV